MYEDQVHCAWLHSWAHGLGCYEKPGRASHSEQANNKHSSMAFTSLPASMSLPCLDSCFGLPQWISYLNKLFTLQVLTEVVCDYPLPWIQVEIFLI